MKNTTKIPYLTPHIVSVSFHVEAGYQSAVPTSFSAVPEALDENENDNHTRSLGERYSTQDASHFF